MAGRTHNDYHVGWVCALPKEQTAAIAMLDQRHASQPQKPNDHNTYTLGSIGKHNIVVDCLPKGKIGVVSATTVATQMINTFPSIKFGLMVGIGGGISLKVRLGDIVVGTPIGAYPGVVHTNWGGSKIPTYMNEMVSKYPSLQPNYLRSESLEDIRFKAKHEHRNDNGGHEKLEENEDEDEQEEEEGEESCRYCDKTQVVKRKPRDHMLVHYGLIASGNSVIKNAMFRDKLRKDLGEDVLCVEMEAAGLMDNFPCIVIRGICDYADSHKNKVWQEHAAGLAAAYAKELLGYCNEPALHHLRVSSDLSSIKENTAQTRSHLNRREDLEILNWLVPTDYGPQQTDYLKRREPGTGKWLLHSKEYKNWVVKPRETLFCPGIPGAGKTVLASVVVNDLETRFYYNADIAVCYIYCNYKRKDEQTVENLLSSLLKQLAQNQPFIPQSLKELYDRHTKGTKPSYDEISNALESVALQSLRVYIIVDALDECQDLGGCRTKFLSAIFKLQGRSNRVNILATSRKIPEIMDRFRDCPMINIRATKDDTRRYLRSRLPELPGFVIDQCSLRDDIITKITEAASGMFLLAQLHFASLIGKYTPKAIRKTLENLVTGSRAYDAAYELAMARIRGQVREQAENAKKVLLWITCATRPLTKIELQHALAIEDVVSVCAGLVTVDEESNVVRLVHYATQDYFTRTQDKWFPDAQLLSAKLCITYLSYQDFASGICKSFRKFIERKKLHPFYDYAACNWAHHGRQASAYQQMVSFLQKPNEVSVSAQALQTSTCGWVSRSPGEITGLHLAAYLGLNEAVVQLLLATEGVNPNSKDSSGWTPLSWAAWKGHRAVVQLLLATEGIDPNSKDSNGQTPLSWAAENGHEAIVQILLATEGMYNAQRITTCR
ncbi:hypothetical protein F5B17DRAFT_437029 [Nemania serpens]|nr:hypothetical protein F5B17DRAFT_437029 [Nemania serpens]